MIGVPYVLTEDYPTTLEIMRLQANGKCCVEGVAWTQNDQEYILMIVLLAFCSVEVVNDTLR